MQINQVSLEDTIKALRGGGNAAANAMDSARQGYQRAEDQNIEARKAALQKRIAEAGLVTGGELGGLPNVAPDRELNPAVAELLINKNAPPKPPAPGMEPLSPEGQQAILDSLPSDAQRAALREPLKSISAKDAGNIFSRNYLPLTVQERAPETQGRTEATKAFNVGRRAAANATNSLAVIRSAAENLGDFKTGVFNQLGSKVGMDWKRVAADPVVTKYLASVDQQLSSLARGPFAERGVLTDQDVARVREALGSPTLPLAQKKEFISMLEGKMYADLAETAEVAGKPKEAESYRVRSKKLLGSRDPMADLPEVAQSPDSNNVPQQTGSAEPTLADIDAEIARRKAARGGR